MTATRWAQRHNLAIAADWRTERTYAETHRELETHQAGGHPDVDRTRYGCIGCDDQRAADHLEGLHEGEDRRDVCLDCFENAESLRYDLGETPEERYARP